MCVCFDVTSPDNAFDFLLTALEAQPSRLVSEYLLDYAGDADLFVEHNKHRLDSLDLNEVCFVAFHVTGSLDDCEEIKRNGIRDLRYVLSRNTMLSTLLRRAGVVFDIDNRIMRINEKSFDIDYDHYRSRICLTSEEECLESIAHRVCYDFCVDGFLVNDDIEGYGTKVHERPEFLIHLARISSGANQLELFWRKESRPYKVFFYATLEQIQKFTFDLEKNRAPYTKNEQEAVKAWMLRLALNRAFNHSDEQYLYINDHMHIPPKQIIRCELLK